jgi:hypothetical protein
MDRMNVKGSSDPNCFTVIRVMLTDTTTRIIQLSSFDNSNNIKHKNNYTKCHRTVIGRVRGKLGPLMNGFSFRIPPSVRKSTLIKQMLLSGGKEWRSGQ